MAEIDPRNVVYNILAGKNELTAETEKSSKAISSLDKDIKETGKNVENSFKKGGEGLKNYTKLLQDAENKSKRLGREIREQEKITNDFQRRLSLVNQRLSEVGKNSVQFQKLTKEANLLKQSIQDNNVALRGLKIDKRNIDESVTSLQKLSTAAKGSAVGVKDLGEQATRALPQLGGITGALTRLGPLGLAAGAAIGGIAAAFNLATSRVQAFGESSSIVFAGLQNTLDNVKDQIALIFADAFSGDFGKALEGIDVFFGLTTSGKQAKKILDQELKRRREAARELKKLDIEANKERIATIRELATLEREEADALLKFEEARSKGRLDLGALDEAESKVNRIFEIRIGLQEKLNKIEVERNKLILSGITEKEQEELNLAALEELAAQKSGRIKAIERRRKELISEETGIILELRDQIKKLTAERDTAKDPLRLIEIGEQIKEVTETLALFEDLATNGFKRIQEAANQIDLLKPDEVQLSADQIRAELTKLVAELDKLAFPDSAFGKAIQARVNKLKDELKAVDPLIANINQSLGAVGRFQTGLDQDAADQAARDATIERAREEASQLAVIAGELTQAFLREEQQRTDRQIELAQDRVNAFRALAEQGSAEQLQLEEERLARLTELREEQARKERIIAAAQIAAANAVAIAKGIQSVISGFSSGNPVLGIANAIALAATVGSTILALKNATSSIPAFAEGTEYVKLNGAPKGRDTVLARLDEGERVVPKKQNAMLNGIPNEKLVEAVKYYQFNQRVKDDAVRPSGSNNLPLIQEIRQMREDIRDMQMFLSVNEFGIAAGVQRANTKKKRIKNLARG